jgi:hypothetical protein
MELRHSRVDFAWHGRVLRVPAELRITAPAAEPHQLHARAEVVLFERRVTLEGDVDFAAGRSQWRLMAPGIPVMPVMAAAGRHTAASVSGRVDLAAEAAFQLAPFAVESAELRITSNELLLQQGPAVARKPDGGPPARLDITRAKDGAWDVRLTDLSLAAPLPVTALRLNARVLPAAGGVDARGTGSLAVGLPAAVSSLPGVVPAEFSFELSPSGAWQFFFSGKEDVNPPALPDVQWNDMEINAAVPRFAVSGEGSAAQGAVRFAIDAGPLRLRTPGTDAGIGALSMAGSLRWNGSETAGAEITLRGETATVALGASKDQTMVRIPAFTLSGEGPLVPTAESRFKGKVAVSGGVVSAPEQRINISGIRLELPVSWPWPASGNAGSLAFAALGWEGRRLGSLNGRLRTLREGLGFDGRFFSRLLPGMVWKLTGRMPFLDPETPVVLAWSGSYHPDTPLDLGRFSKDARGTTVGGRLAVEGRIRLEGGQAAGSMSVDLSDGWISAAERGLRMEGIRLGLTFPALPDLRSAPAQTFSAAALTLGSIRLEDASIRFQIEPDATVLLERGRFKWCGGNVNTGSLRISPDMTDLDLTLYCDRLNLAQLLEQLGAARAEGEGAVNGRIPIRIRKDRLQFDDGFLYSTPGDGGVIHVTGAQVLTAGIPADTPQASQINLAVEALKSYEYTWAKLRIGSEGENLRLKLQFDGKPTAPLPFVYREEFGGFVRVDASHPGSRFQGIRLDVNLGLPLDKILRYRGLMDMIP